MSKQPKKTGASFETPSENSCEVLAGSLSQWTFACLLVILRIHTFWLDDLPKGEPDPQLWSWAGMAEPWTCLPSLP